MKAKYFYGHKNLKQVCKKTMIILKFFLTTWSSTAIEPQESIFIEMST